MRTYPLLFAALMATAVASCGRPEPKRSSEDLKTYDADSREVSTQTMSAPAAPPPPPPMVAPPPLVRAEEGRSVNMSADQAGGPNIAVTSAPGVAFDYRYAFRLDNARIQPMQEAHAAACEKLGIARCRITGMRYALVNERDIQASLELKLAPELARAFGKDATRAVTEAKGMLVEQEIRGTDMAPAIEGANRGRAELQDELDRVNRELARSGLSNVLRDRLLSEAQSIRAQMRGLGEQKKSAEAALATTPMLFVYGSGAQVPGMDEERPLAEALSDAGLGFQRALGSLILVSATLLPWLALLFLLWLAARRFGLLRWARAERGYLDSPAAD